MGSKSSGSGTMGFIPSFSSQTTSPDPQAGAAYSSFLKRAQDVSNTPYTPYTGQLVAGPSLGAG
ncbi:MAG TPA: hypothetical protein VIF34_10150 [Methylocystis sp.]|jgi:hypothetical protein